MLGNNPKSAKFRRIFIPLTRDNTLSSPFGGRYFFPAEPELENKNITAIQVHLGEQLVPSDISSPNVKILLGTLTTNISLAQPIATYSFLTIINKDGSEMLYNFPIQPLFNQIPSQKIQRIHFTPGKINFEKSYILIPITGGTVGNVLGYSITFFYN